MLGALSKDEVIKRFISTSGFSREQAEILLNFYLQKMQSSQRNETNAEADSPTNRDLCFFVRNGDHVSNATAAPSSHVINATSPDHPPLVCVQEPTEAQLAAMLAAAEEVSSAGPSHQPSDFGPSAEAPSGVGAPSLIAAAIGGSVRSVAPATAPAEDVVSPSPSSAPLIPPVSPILPTCEVENPDEADAVEDGWVEVDAPIPGSSPTATPAPTVVSAPTPTGDDMGAEGLSDGAAANADGDFHFVTMPPGEPSAETNEGEADAPTVPHPFFTVGEGDVLLEEGLVAVGAQGLVPTAADPSYAPPPDAASEAAALGAHIEISWL